MNPSLQHPEKSREARAQPRPIAPTFTSKKGDPIHLAKTEQPPIASAEKQASLWSLDLSNTLRSFEQPDWSDLLRPDKVQLSAINNRKRALSRAPTSLLLLSGHPPSKKQRHHSRIPRFSDPFIFSRGVVGDSHPTAPPFFSDSAHSRPSLPLRLLSSEAGIAMLSKVNGEDSSSVRTLKMARGSYTTSTSARQSSASSGQNSIRGFNVSPDEEEISAGLTTLGQVGAIELLVQDERPSFVIDLEDRVNFEPGPLRIMFANPSLRACTGVLELITGKADQGSPGLAAVTAFSQFKAWSTNYARNYESLEVSLPSIFFAGVRWTCSTLRKRLRVIKGNPEPATTTLDSNSPSVETLTYSNVGKENKEISGSGSNRSFRRDQSSDYFGDTRSSSPFDGRMAGVRSHLLDPQRGSNSTLSPTTSQGKPNEPGEISFRTSSLLLSGSSSGSDAASPLGSRLNEAILGAASASHVDQFSVPAPSEQAFFDWTRLPITAALPRHIQFARSIDWASTKLGPIEEWSSELRSMCNLIMASPHPAAMYWGEDLITIYNEAYILLAGQKHPYLMGHSYREVWAEIWDAVKDVFASARSTGQATMKDDDCLFLERSSSGFLEETYFSWSIIPLVGADGSVVGLYNPAFEKTRRKIVERRMLTLREVGEKTAAARDLKSFWREVLKALEYNENDAPFVLVYSVIDSLGLDIDSDASSMQSQNTHSTQGSKQCVLEGTLGVPNGHRAAPTQIDLKSGTDFLSHVFKEAMKSDRPILLQTEDGTLDADLLDGIDWRGFGDPCHAAVCCPINLTSGDSVLGFLVIGINPRRPYDDDYRLFVQLLSRQLATSMASVVLFEEEIARGRRAARLAALDRIELSEQLAARTQEAAESETKFTRMAEFAPVGMFIANSDGRITYCNETWYEISRVPKGNRTTDYWMDSVKDEDRNMVEKSWFNLVHNAIALNAEFRFRAQWTDRNGTKGDTWVLASAYPEKNPNGKLKVIFGSITNISQQKWAEHFEKRRMEEAVEMKRQQENFIDITSHEMRNPLSAILQCADEVTTSLTDYRIHNPLADQIISDLMDNSIDAAQTIALCAQHQKRIVDDILTLSKLDSALLLVTPCDIQPVTVVQRALKMFDGEVQTAGIKLDFRVDDSLRSLDVNWVRLDPSRLLQVLINLTTNAIKFTTTQSKRIITVTLAASTQRPSRETGGNHVSYFPTRSKREDLTTGDDWGNGEKVFIYFAVQDTGRGLSEDETKLLFLRFSQTSPRTHVQYGGSGLGLFISRELVELQGGEIGVSSRAGEGSTFAFYVKARKSTAPTEIIEQLPVAGIRKSSFGKQPSFPASSKSPSRAAPPEKPKAREVLKILIVEDNLVNQRVLQKQLRNLGCVVHVANHGGECLDRLRESTFWTGHGHHGLDLSVILMDLEMPIMDGLTCARKIRELEASGEVVRHVPIIAVTANARNEQIDTALAAGMVSFCGDLLE